MADDVERSEWLTGSSQLLERVCQACIDRLPITGVSLSVTVRPGVWTTVYASDSVAQRLEDLQFEVGEGPSVDVLDTRSPVLVEDLDHPPAATVRWPVFGPDAVELGVRAVFGYPVQVGGAQLGVLLMYRDAPGGLNWRERANALRLADAMFYAVLDRLSGSLRDAGLDGVDAAWLDRPSELFRAEIHQATGIIMGQLGISIEEATVRLRAAAFVLNRPLIEVAREIIDRVLRLDDDNGETEATDGSRHE